MLNFGVAGYGAGQEYLQLQHKVARFHPEIVLLDFYIGNDVPDNNRALSVWKEKPYFVELPSGELSFDTSFRDSEAYRHTVKTDWILRLINASYVLQALKQVYLGYSIRPTPLKSQIFKATGTDPVRNTLQYPLLFGPPRDEAWRSAWSVTEKLIKRMQEWSQRQRIDFRIDVIPDPIQALPGEAMRRAAVEKYHLVDLDYPVTRIIEFARQNGIPSLSLLEPMRIFADGNRQFLYGFDASSPGDGHLNAVGNDVSGRAIAAWLCKTLAPSAR